VCGCLRCSAFNELNAGGAYLRAGTMSCVGLQALVLLNALLFGNPPPAAAVSQQQEHAAVPTASGQTSTGGDSNPSSSHGNSSPSSSHSSSSRGLGGYWSSVWPRNKDLWGPDLSGFVVPTDGHSGLGLKVGCRCDHPACL
jgi:hypothetical protein